MPTRLAKHNPEDEWVSGWARFHVWDEEDYSQPPIDVPFSEYRVVSPEEIRQALIWRKIKYGQASGAHFWRCVGAGLIACIPGLHWLLWVSLAFGVASVIYWIAFCHYGSERKPFEEANRE